MVLAPEVPVAGVVHEWVWPAQPSLPSQVRGRSGRASTQVPPAPSHTHCPPQKHVSSVGPVHTPSSHVKVADPVCSGAESVAVNVSRCGVTSLGSVGPKCAEQV